MILIYIILTVLFVLNIVLFLTIKKVENKIINWRNYKEGIEIMNDKDEVLVQLEKPFRK